MSDSEAHRHVKVLLDVERDDGATDVESLWAVPVEGQAAPAYRLDNIPFYAIGFAVGDIITATPDVDGMLRCTGLAVASGHSTVRLWFADAKDVQRIRDELRAIGCSSELDHKRLVAVDIPPDVPYSAVRAYLDSVEKTGLLEYEEACLAQVTGHA